ncbi:hypothetical protein NUW58_g1134 [Xylaria curta]|uniref:Uncharacterized protein n=1 Tax=Xylaria curta TaxID=42375 RepID=A0ACC1PLJ5_9PEZI|nr:hypothetical protein NUW58_g1134 [Xylaria curta]
MPSKPQDPIAIVGSGCHFAGDVNSTSQLWDLLRQPRDVRSVIPDDRFNAEGWYHPNGSYHGHCNVKQSYMMSRKLGQFDTGFFGIKPLEAKALDPQQAFLLETVYEALEAAGLKVGDLKGSDTGVYVGAMSADIEGSLVRDTQSIPTYMTTGSTRSMISNRISYFFGWQGPSITVDTACSSSLVAVHMAVQALRAGECQMAVVCGANILLGPETYVAMSKLGMLSPDSLSRMWDRDANGYARGDGISAVILKTLSKALADADDIECLIRETGVNQDGATSDSLTLPSSSAQQGLIRSVYRKANLNNLRPEDQPQYFEAHGTGTPAGDPIEAAGIHGAFFQNHEGRTPGQAPMYVGSVKTVIGHTEGSAGIAAILKASLALRYACIPPNLHFNNLSESVAPYYQKFEISKTLKPWPEIPEGRPRRASVNSFGIGGTNAHAILESYEDTPDDFAALEDNALFTPFVFSAGSEKSLRKLLDVYATFLDSNLALNAQRLAWTLRQRRSVLRCRAAFTADSIHTLKSRVSERLAQVQSSADRNIGTPSSGERGCSILGIFTGQGAQYARMGAELIEKSTAALQIIQRLDSYLADLPAPDRPAWTLEAELLTHGSRIHMSTISQPICTAIQILITDLLQVANVAFSAVIGHSSGEIGAAYAAGYITARDAIYIAYYRGIHLNSACSPRGAHIRGAMLAAGISMEEAKSLCRESVFRGRICLAASNSPSSVTISGDEDAVLELQKVLTTQEKFNRELRVDRAYHSAHVLPCLDGYIKSLVSCAVKPLKASAHRCTWYSSVHGRPIDEASGLETGYWAKNLSDPVLFSHAVEVALAGSAFDIVLEVGPHPTLQGPTRQTVQYAMGKALPYHGTLSREVGAVEAMSDALGFLWAHSGARGVDLDEFERFMVVKKRNLRPLKDLPAYQWNHDVIYRNEPRISRRLRMRKPVHSLLGDMSVDSGSHLLGWRNLLRESEIDWLQDHQIQGQTIFPAAGYISTALEASQALAGKRSIRLVEMRNFQIHQAIGLDQGDNGVEVVILLTDITMTQSGRTSAKFTYSAALGAAADELTLAATTDIEITLGDPFPELLPERASTPPYMIDVKPELFYQVMDGLGYQWRGRFSSLHSIHRKNAMSSCTVKMRQQEETSYGKPLTIHPAELDSAFQSIFLARGYPGDEQLPCLHLPQSCALIRVNPLLCESMANKDGFATVDATVEVPELESKGFSASVDIYPHGGNNAAIQLEEIVLKPLKHISEEEDRKVFYKTHWLDSNPNGLSAACGITIGERHKHILRTLLRTSSFYLRRLVKDVPCKDLSMALHNSHYLQYARHIKSLLDEGKGLWIRKEWENDTLDDIMKACETIPEIPDVPLMHIVGQRMPLALKGEVNMLEELRASGLLDDYYLNGFGLREAGLWTSKIIRQLTDRYPKMRILEIGAGTGAATKSILRAVGQNFLSYTFTDLSASFAETAETVFSEHRHQGTTEFKVFNVEKDPTEQGYAEGGYDLVVAFSVLHATSKLDRSLRNIRKLLRPGGFLVVVEGSDSPQPGGVAGFIFGSLPGWWLGVSEGRTFSPFISNDDWDKQLRTTGFSGIDETVPKEFQDVFGVTVFVSQAVDDHVDYLRAPLSRLPLERPISKFFIVGGKTEHTTPLTKALREISKSFVGNSYVFNSLGDVDYDLIDHNSVVACLTDLDKPVFQYITPDVFLSLKTMLGSPKTILWVTTGRRATEPYSNMTVGFGRTAMNETPGLRLQFLDIEDPRTIQAQKVAEFVMRLHATTQEGQKTLWSFEPEIVIDPKGRELLPRLRHIPSLNDRYNSKRRRIVRNVDTKSKAVVIRREGTGWTAKELTAQQSIGDGAELVEIRTTYSITSAIKTRSGYGFLALGIEPASKAKYLALIPTLTSVIRLPSSSLVRCHDTQLSDSLLLVLVASYLVALIVLDPLWGKDAVLVHNSPIVIAEAIAMKASSEHTRVVFTTDYRTHDTPSSWVTLRPYISGITLRRILPSTVSCFVGLTNRDLQGLETQSNILSCLSSHCRKETTETIFSPHGSEEIVYSPTAVLDLKQALDDATRHEPKVLDKMKATIGTYILHYLDITDRAELEAAKEEITKTLPQIGGVLNGAVVLRDVTIRNMSFEQLSEVTGPKVQGSMYLDQLFKDDDLEFFLLFSSVNSVYGNPGQANYAAASAYVCALAEQRRQRGLAATAIDIGTIFGVGYLEREMSKMLELTISRMSLMHLSEVDFHQIIAESIECGRPGSLVGPELSTGLVPVAANSHDAPVWASNPRFAAFVVHKTKEEGRGGREVAGPTIGDQLKQCTERKDVETVIQGALVARLRKVLQLTSADDDLMSMRTREIGMDSLIAADTRTWLLKIFGVSVPALKIMGNDTLASLGEYIAASISGALAPKVGRTE